jgi:penicillin-binding protein 2
LASVTERPPVARPPRKKTAEPGPERVAPRLGSRATILIAVALAAFAVLFLRLWALQVLSGTSYLATAQNNQLRTLRLEAPRGPILDRNGKVVVTNAAGTAVEIWPADLPKTWPLARAELRRLSTVVDVPAREIWRRLNARKGDRLTPVLIRSSIHPDAFNYLSEHQDAFPGVRISTHFLRRYPYQSLLAQVLGHVGEIDQAQLKALRSKGYAPGDEIGQAGVEAAYDGYLRGRNGVATLRVDAQGRPKSAIVTRVLQAHGNAIRLTVDIGLQRAAEQALTYGIDLARADKQWNAAGGAIVAMDPRDGAILAMASNPTFKPSVYTGRPDRKKLATLLDAGAAAEANFPGLDRATQGVYPPGSTFKPVTALAAMQAHVLQPRSLLPCTPDYESHDQTFKNWTDAYNRGMNLVEAMATSCDTYFYRVGESIYGLGDTAGHPIQDWAAKFGIGQKTGIDIGGEQAGLLPTPEWRRETFTKQTDPCCWAVDSLWKPGDSIQLAIGQKDIAVTPLQMTRLYALIANGGYLVTPHVVEDVEQPGSNVSDRKVLRRFGAQPPQRTSVDPAALQVVQTGLYAATHSAEGTSQGVFGRFPVEIAGKTGTAEKIMHVDGYPDPHTEDQAWWCGYGPYANPELVVCALIENGGHGGVAAAPAALRVFEQYFGRRGQVTTHASD